jgi:hypothetical protein
MPCHSVLRRTRTPVHAAQVVVIAKPHRFAGQEKEDHKEKRLQLESLE